MSVLGRLIDIARRLRPSDRSPEDFVLHLAVLATIASPSCNRAPRADPAVVQATPAPTTTAASVPHGDHNPHHGGIVMMKGDNLHYEVVLDPAGRAHHVYFTDALREDLPASVASDVVLTIHRPKTADERIPLQIDEAGESWIGSGGAVADPAATTVRLAFSIRQEPYWIDLPFTPGK
jgi:hypothetical protein